MAEKDDKWLDHLTPTQTRQEGEIVRRFSASGRRISVTDAVFGDIVEGGPNVSTTQYSNLYGVLTSFSSLPTVQRCKLHSLLSIVAQSLRRA